MLARLDVAGFVVPDRLGRFARRALPFSLCGKNETDVFSNIRPLFPQPGHAKSLFMEWTDRLLLREILRGAGRVEKFRFSSSLR